jgi:DNA repair protein RadD
MFDHIVFDGSSVEYFNWFISEGYLMPLIPKRTKMQLDVSGVGKRGGEYISSELQAAVNKAEANQLALNEALAVAGDRKKWLVFCAGVEHAEDFAELLNQNGVKACAVHSKMGGKERDQAIADFKSGKIMALTNNNVLTTGFDCPDIDLIIMLRPTGSPVLWVQMLGRGTRPVYAPGFDLSDREQRLAAIAASDKQNCLVLDFSGNSRRLGPINDPAVPRRPGQKTIAISGQYRVRKINIQHTLDNESKFTAEKGEAGISIATIVHHNNSLNSGRRLTPSWM